MPWFGCRETEPGEVARARGSRALEVAATSRPANAVGDDSNRIRPNRILPNRIRPNRIRPNRVRPNCDFPNGIASRGPATRPHSKSPSASRPTCATKNYQRQRLHSY